MENLMSSLTGIGLESISDYDPAAHAQLKADSLNRQEGDRNQADGYDCRICRNKGYIAKAVEERVVFADCKCAETRRSIQRMQSSGLKNVIKEFTFEKYDATENWQKTIKAAAFEYAKNPVGWFALFGQSGCGKTHLCTAICRTLLLSGKSVRYMLWRDEIVRIKQGGEGLQDLLDSFKTAEVLYIDDLFKSGDARPTSADISHAFEIINYRYNNPELLTVISSEFTIEELLGIDEAIGGRIYERANVFSIDRNRDRNYRIRKAVSI